MTNSPDSTPCARPTEPTGPAESAAAAAPVEHVEVERSYDAPAGAAPPDLAGVEGITSTTTEPTRHLEATYVDTADLALVRARTTLRRRVGGKDDGWHLKLPASESGETRRELQAPLADDLPASLAAAVAGVVDDEPLVPLVRVVNDRTTTLLHGPGGVLAEVCHDRVRTEGLRDGIPNQEWVEWEVELVDGDLALLDRVESALLAAGASRLALGSKLVRALGPIL